MASHLRTAEAMASGLAVENISMGGLFVRCATAFQVGMPVTVQLVRPGLKRAIRMTGRVVSVVSPAEARARGSVPGMGIGLDSIEQDTAERLRDLVDGLVAARPREPRRG